ncbi:MAG: DUF1501 domain-containing protein [Verrucomicrobiaceae bacterium]|nr:DUF1501 domain-containing protein [Verrucomicrobiaceae bacterium]
MIFLFMYGGPSHVDLFDPKPELAKWQAKPSPCGSRRMPSRAERLKMSPCRATTALRSMDRPASTWRRRFRIWRGMPMISA